MLVEYGHLLLITALLMSLLQVLPIFMGRYRYNFYYFMNFTVVMQFLCVAFAFFVLINSYIVSDFSVLNVFLNSSSGKPLLYKIVGVWGNHEGSLLLWVLVLSIFSILFVGFFRNIPINFYLNTISIQALVSLCFLSLIIFTSNPFARIAPVPLEGRDLNPLLQDIGLAIHPPLLYLGYVGFSIVFSMAIASLFTNRVNWIVFARPWIVISWIFLTLGISMGSYWAYYELGWGGIWFWDPVENASLMPWLAGTALMHSAIALEKRDILSVWCIFLAILTFSLSLFGTFLVRSGLLTSVHSFAVDPTRGISIFMLMFFLIGGAFTVFALRANSLLQSKVKNINLISREGVIVLNNFILCISCFTVFIGTIYPLLLETLTGEQISVGAPFFNFTFGSIFLFLLFLLSIGQSFSWGRVNLYLISRRICIVLLFCFIIFLLLISYQTINILFPAMICLGLFVIFTSLFDFCYHLFFINNNYKLFFKKIGMYLAHMGLGITLIGIAASSGWGVSNGVVAKIGDTIEVGDYYGQINNVRFNEESNYKSFVVDIDIIRSGVKIKTIQSEQRIYTIRDTQTTEVGLAFINFGHIYAAIDRVNDNETIKLYLHWKPLITLVWIGTIVMVLGGIIAFLNNLISLYTRKRIR